MLKKLLSILFTVALLTTSFAVFTPTDTAEATCRTWGKGDLTNRSSHTVMVQLDNFDGTVIWLTISPGQNAQQRARALGYCDDIDFVTYYGGNWWFEWDEKSAGWWGKIGPRSFICDDYGGTVWCR